MIMIMCENLQAFNLIFKLIHYMYKRYLLVVKIHFSAEYPHDVSVWLMTIMIGYHDRSTSDDHQVQHALLISSLDIEY